MKVIRFSALVLFSCWLLSHSAAAKVVNEREYNIKAAFMANFIRYTHWYDKPQQSFQFCSLNPSVNKVLSHQLKQESWFGLVADFKLTDLSNVEGCHLLFIDKWTAADNKNIHINSESLNMLIISESRKSTQLFSHINFFFTDNKLRFEINVERLEKSKLSMQPSLLRLARITYTHKEDL